MNSVALITGGSRGIGRGIALELAKAGWDLVINYAGHLEAAQKTAADCQTLAITGGCPIRIEICQADISLSADRQKLIEFTRQSFGRLDLLVNNAGIAPAVRADLLEASEASFDQLIQVNLKGPYFLTQLAARWMIEQCPGPQQMGTPLPPASPAASLPERREAPMRPRPKIVTISSISAYTASVNRGDYCLAKAALSMLTLLYAARLAEYGINVYEIRPGIIATDMTRVVKDKYDRLINNGLTPIQRWGTPEDVGKAVTAIAQDLLPFSTGEVINVDGGFHIRRL